MFVASDRFYLDKCSVGNVYSAIVWNALLFLLLFMILLSLFPSWFSACFCQLGYNTMLLMCLFVGFTFIHWAFLQSYPFCLNLCLMVHCVCFVWEFYNALSHELRAVYIWGKCSTTEHIPLNLLQIFYSLRLTIFLWYFLLLLNMSLKCFYVFCSVVQGEVFCKCWVILCSPLTWIIQMNKALKR